MAYEYLDKTGTLWIFSKVKNELAGKVDKVDGKSLSTNDYTTAEKTKLEGIAEGAEVNVQADWGDTDTASDAYIKNKPGNASTSAAGLMSSTDYAKLAGFKEATSYWTSDEVQTAINSAVGSITGIEYTVVDALPATGESGVIYLVAHSHGTNDAYDEYIWVSSSSTFEKIGNTDVDLSGYVATSDMDEIDATELSTMWDSVATT